MSRIDEIEKCADVLRPMPRGDTVVSHGHLGDMDWLISRVRRYEKALRRIEGGSNTPDYWYVKIAREALEGEEK